MARARFGDRGQAILEYLVVAAVIVAAIFLARPALQTAISGLFNNAAVKANDAAASMGRLNVTVP